MSHPDSVAGIPIAIPETVTWAGETPGSPRFVLALGTEGGRVWFRLENGDLYGGLQVVESGEAVNGIAAANALMAVSSRSEVDFLKLGETETVYRYDGGAHGVISTPTGRFIAPLGPFGVLVAGGQAEQLYHKELLTRGRELYFYRLVSLGTNDRGDELIAGTCRHGGIIAISLDRAETANELVAYSSPERDIVDICPIGGNRYPHAIASLGSDGSVHLSFDLVNVNGPTPVALRYPQIQGTVYAIRSGHGHIFVLTSNGLYIVPHLASRFLEGKKVDGPSSVRCVEIDAFDIAVGYDRWLIPLQPKSVSLIPLADLWAEEPGAAFEQPTYYAQSWEPTPPFNLESVLV